MLMNGKWVTDWQPVQAKDEKGGFVRQTSSIPGVRETVSIDHTKHGYYSIKALNPGGIVPVGPELPATLLDTAR